jgi:hypothetical protein
LSPPHHLFGCAPAGAFELTSKGRDCYQRPFSFLAG